MRFGHTLQGFSAGILSPDIHGRFDYGKLALGVSDAKNFWVRHTGAISYRPGTRFIAKCKFPDKDARLIKFGSSRAAVYNIETGDLYMRFFRSQSAIVTSFAITNGDFPTDIAGWTDLSSGGGSIAWNAGDQRMTLTGATGWAEQALTTVVNQDYIVNVDVFDNDLKVVIGTTSGGSEIFEKTVKVGTARQVFFKATATTTYLGFKQDAALSSDIDNVTAVEPVEIVTPYTEAQVSELRYAQNGDDLYITHPSHPAKKLTRVSDTSWTLANMVFDPSATTVTGLTLTPGTFTGTVARPFDWRYTVTTEDADGNESLPFAKQTVTGDIEIADQQITVDITTPSESGVRYKVYRQGGGELYLIHIIDSDSSTSYSFVDSGLTADESRSVPVVFGELQSVNNYPIACGVYNQRLVLGGTINDPDKLWFSRVQEFENFSNTVILAEDEGFNKRLSSGSVNKIQHLQTLDDLMCLTDGKVWRIRGSGRSDLQAFVESSVGAASPKPFPTKKSMLFVESNGNTVSDFIYTDQVNGYDGDDLDILSRSLFKKYTIDDLSFQNSPDKLLYCVRSDGSMPVLTYLKNQDVFAWTYYDTDGEFKSVSSLDQDVFDDTYVIVKRNINGSDVRFIELFEVQYQDVDGTDDDWYLDTALRYEGTATDTFGGLDHLIGEEVSVYADSDVLASVTVDSSGYITLPDTYEKILVGLPYDGILKLITAQTSTPDKGTTIGVQRSLIDFAMSVLESRGFFYSVDGVNYEEYDTVDSSEIGGPIPKVTDTFVEEVEGESGTQPTLYIAQKQPLPLTILNITLGIEFGER